MSDTPRSVLETTPCLFGTRIEIVGLPPSTVCFDKLSIHAAATIAYMKAHNLDIKPEGLIFGLVSFAFHMDPPQIKVRVINQTSEGQTFG